MIDSTTAADPGIPATLALHEFCPRPVPRWKRVLDIICILLAAPFVLPLAALIGLFIKCVSPGGVIFRQKRVGYLGRPFWCLKFRTMHEAAETVTHENYLRYLMAHDQPLRKLEATGDKRLISGGWILRSFGLDELPQLINVLRGEMSLVGPRPCLPYEYDFYDPRQRQRCAVLPGLTGLWQVGGKNRTTFREMIERDLHYAEHYSLLMDLGIMARTAPAILGQTRDLMMARRGHKSSLPQPAASLSHEPHEPVLEYVR